MKRRARWRHAQSQGPFLTAATGMTLIELLVVVAIAAILALAALPGYRAYVLRANRVEARSALLAVAAAQETHYLHHNEYTTELTAGPPDGLGSRRRHRRRKLSSRDRQRGCQRTSQRPRLP